MKLKLLFLIIALSFNVAMAKNTTDYIKKAITYISPSYLPYDSEQKSEFMESFFIPNDGYVIPDKLYDDFQLTKFKHASDYEDL